jgi:hypothetical protein
MTETRAELGDHINSLKQYLFGSQPEDTNIGGDTVMATSKRSSSKSTGGSQAKGIARKGSSAGQRSEGDDPRPRKSTADKGGTAAKSTGSRKSSGGGGAGQHKTTPEKRSKAAASSRSAGASKSKGKGTKRAKSGSSATRRKVVEAVGEVLAGAAVGAVTGAAARVGNQPASTLQLVDDQGRFPSGASSPPEQPSKILTEMASGAAVGALSGAAKTVLPESKGRTQGSGSRSKKSGGR